ncbi:MAG: nucleotidyltransferase domain-containing protein [Deltaproteobacteria bacterium]|nr:nucleotidyltransferase domain-containing protein [Deltaproteobacteria bacterium]
MSVAPKALARLLVNRRKVTNAKAQERGELLQASVRGKIKELYKSGIISRAWLIGSLARKSFGIASDVDIVIEGLKTSDISKLAAELTLHFQVEVDLLRFEQLPLSFQKRVLAEGVRLNEP